MEEQPEENICLASQLAFESHLTNKGLQFLIDASRDACEFYDLELPSVTNLSLDAPAVNPEKFIKLDPSTSSFASEINVMTTLLTSAAPEDLLHDSESDSVKKSGHLHMWADGVFECDASQSFFGQGGLQIARWAQMVSLELVNLQPEQQQLLAILYPRIRNVFETNLDFWNHTNAFYDVAYLQRIQDKGLLAWVV